MMRIASSVPHTGTIDICHDVVRSAPLRVCTRNGLYRSPPQLRIIAPLSKPANGQAELNHPPIDSPKSPVSALSCLQLIKIANVGGHRHHDREQAADAKGIERQRDEHECRVFGRKKPPKQDVANY